MDLASHLPGLEIWTEPERLLSYGQDEAFKRGERPLAVVFARSADDVVRVMRFASAGKTPVIPRGAGSGLSGAAVPLGDAIVLSLEKMNRILEVSEEERTVTAEPGVITGEIRKAVEARGLFYPPIPASVDLCTIGGNVATNAGGLCAVKYGVTREYLLGLEAVLPSGERIETGGKLLKNSTGYNLTQLICGSEGTLAVITRITMRLLPLPRERVTLLAPFASASAVTEAIVAILGGGLIPPTLELIPKAAVDAVLARHTELTFPYPDAAASLLVELDSRDGASIPAELESLERALAARVSAPPAVASTAAQRDNLWSVRKLVRDSVANSGDYEEADSVVPRIRVPELLRASEEVGRDLGLEVISYGHAGDGNLHTYFRRGSTPDDRWPALSQEALRRYFERTVALGGTLSGEHGIGYLKRDFMPMALSKPQLDLMRRLKAAFDPDGILNPGKVIPA